MGAKKAMGALHNSVLTAQSTRWNSDNNLHILRLLIARETFI